MEEELLKMLFTPGADILQGFKAPTCLRLQVIMEPISISTKKWWISATVQTTWAKSIPQHGRMEEAKRPQAALECWDVRDFLSEWHWGAAVYLSLMFVIYASALRVSQSKRYGVAISSECSKGETESMYAHAWIRDGLSPWTQMSCQSAEKMSRSGQGVVPSRSP